ncbi:MAG: xanthine dehydrogenase family protein [Candidatus Rokubacteria bacterium]|nr:xanthine dehydrogenase family protein [Candidatus Rokubacteria bacterium]MBI3826308.1 xanthine dehydrogenase family protein [Candidatus Rokubacteria bacterium]
MPLVGSPLKRPDDPRLLTGRGRYVDDLVLPRLVHVAFVRSEHAHARIAGIDLAAARRAPGVVAVMTGPEAARLCKPYRGVLLHYKGMKTGAMLPLAVDRVRCVGEPVVAVAATDRGAAEDAARLVRVAYEPLAAVVDADDATVPGAPLIHEDLGDNVIYETRLASGDVDQAFARAHRVWARTFTIGRHTGVPMEPRGLVADFEPATRALTLWISSQVPHMMQAVVAELFGLPEHRVRVIAPDVGGSFGIKIHVYQDDMAACALALALGRPVKWVPTRRESFLSDIHAREQTVAVEVAAERDGTLTAMRARITAAVGPYSAYPRSSVVEGGQVLRLLPGPYHVRAYDASLRVVAQNKGVTSQYRAVGHPIATAVTESMVELIARDLGLDAAEMRRRNLVADHEFPFTSIAGSVFDSGSYRASLERLLEAADYAGLRAEQARRRAAGRCVGIGLACFVELTGPGAQFYGVGGAPISGQDGTTVRLEPSGAVTVLTGLTEQGQGTRTALAQIVGDGLGVPIEAVTVVAGDTGMVPYGGGTWASRGMPVGGSATLLAVRALRERVRRIAARLLEAHEDDVDLAGGRATVRGTGRGLALGEIARTVHFRSNEIPGLEPSVEATVHYTNPGAWTFTNGAHLAMVEIDVETGAVRVVKYVAVDDCGRMVNPALVEGQVQGGIAQGLGGALREHCVYDAAGQLLTTTLMDYAVPTAADLPMIEVHHLETPAPGIAGGYKGAGEGGVAGAPGAILNAVNDALAPHGAMITAQPVTSEKVFHALARGRAPDGRVARYNPRARIETRRAP